MQGSLGSFIQVPQRGLIGISPMAKITQRPIEGWIIMQPCFHTAVDVSPQIAISRQRQTPLRLYRVPHK